MNAFARMTLVLFITATFSRNVLALDGMDAPPIPGNEVARNTHGHMQPTVSVGTAREDILRKVEIKPDVQVLTQQTKDSLTQVSQTQQALKNATTDSERAALQQQLAAQIANLREVKKDLRKKLIDETRKEIAKAAVKK